MKFIKRVLKCIFIFNLFSIYATAQEAQEEKSNTVIPAYAISLGYARAFSIYDLRFDYYLNKDISLGVSLGATLFGLPICVGGEYSILGKNSHRGYLETNMCFLYENSKIYFENPILPFVAKYGYQISKNIEIKTGFGILFSFQRNKTDFAPAFNLISLHYKW